MEPIYGKEKEIVESCKERAFEAGLSFNPETIEYLARNAEFVNLSPKIGIPTHYDYWMIDADYLVQKGEYEAYHNNPYETVINTSPVLSFFNSNNPDWANIMIFYHIFGHMDFFQNNILFAHTWGKDFTGKALSDKKYIQSARRKYGADAVDYIIEFARGIDNLVGYQEELARTNDFPSLDSKRLSYYFDTFIPVISQSNVFLHEEEIKRYNECLDLYPDAAESMFFEKVLKEHPEFGAIFDEHEKTEEEIPILDPIQFVIRHSEYIAKNPWVADIVNIIRDTSLYFQPQRRDMIMNEGWATYWHEKLYMSDPRIKGHEVGFSVMDAHVTSHPRIGYNPYALGSALFRYIEECADKGRYSREFSLLGNKYDRDRFDLKTGKGMEYIFDVRKYYSDYTFINSFITQEFVDKNGLCVIGVRVDPSRGVRQYFVKSRKAEDYKAMVLDRLYHPPDMSVDETKNKDGALYLVHRFEGKPLKEDWINMAMIGLGYLWGEDKLVCLETNEVSEIKPLVENPIKSEDYEVTWKRVVYEMKGRKITKRNL